MHWQRSHALQQTSHVCLQTKTTSPVPSLRTRTHVSLVSATDSLPAFTHDHIVRVVCRCGASTRTLVRTHHFGAVQCSAVQHNSRYSRAITCSDMLCAYGHAYLHSGLPASCTSPTTFRCEDTRTSSRPPLHAPACLDTQIR